MYKVVYNIYKHIYKYTHICVKLPVLETCVAPLSKKINESILHTYYFHQQKDDIRTRVQ